MKTFSIVVAIDEANGIGKQGGLIWHLPPDLKRFKEITSTVSLPGHTNAVIMGRKTWQTLREKFRPLPGRLNMVLTQQADFLLPAPVVRCAQLDQALDYLEQQPAIEHAFVIGGGQLYAEAIQHRACNQILATCLKGNFHCDVFFPSIPSRFHSAETSQWLSYGDIIFRYVNYQAS